MKRFAFRGFGVHRLTAALLFIALAAAGCSRPRPVRLTVLHWNDFHAQNTPREWVNDEGDTVLVGGAAAMAAYLEHYRGALAPTLELNAGDDYQGTPISSFTEGRSQVELLDLLRPDAFAIGNHEFDYGVEALLDGMSNATFPRLLANVVREEDGGLIFPADTVLEAGGVRIGVVGVVTARLKEVTTRQATEGLRVLPPEEAVRRSLDRLEPISDIQVCLSHLGVDADSVLAEEIGPRLELIIGGHSHTALFKPKWVNGVPILQAGAKGAFLGVAELEVDTARNRLFSLQAHLERVLPDRFGEDSTVAVVVGRQERRVARELDIVVGRVAVDLTRRYDGESSLGNWVTDAFREETGADIACINSGGLRKNLSSGPLTAREIFEVSPFGNQMVRFRVTGRELKEFALHQAAHPGSTLQLSGMKYHARDGELVSLVVDGEPVEPERSYSIVTVNYVTDHMDRFFGFAPETHPVEPLYQVDRDVLLAAARREGVISARVEGRAVRE